MDDTPFLVWWPTCCTGGTADVGGWCPISCLVVHELYWWDRLLSRWVMSHSLSDGPRVVLVGQTGSKWVVSYSLSGGPCVVLVGQIGSMRMMSISLSGGPCVVLVGQIGSRRMMSISLCGGPRAVLVGRRGSARSCQGNHCFCLLFCCFYTCTLMNLNVFQCTNTLHWCSCI